MDASMEKINEQNQDIFLFSIYICIDICFNKEAVWRAKPIPWSHFLKCAQLDLPIYSIFYRLRAQCLEKLWSHFSKADITLLFPSEKQLMLQISCQDKNLKQLVAKQFLESAESFIPLLNARHSKRNIYLFSQEHKIGGHAKFTWKCW